MARPKPTRIDKALLKQFAEGRLDSEMEVKLAVAIEKSPDLQARVAALSSDGFLQKVKQVAAQSRNSRPGGPADAKSAVAVPDAPDGIPQELKESPDYQVLKELGRGGMGVVYAAKYLPMDRMEVLKVLNPQLVEKEAARQRFINEMKAIGKLNHPFIATAYQRVVLPTQLVFSMEYVPGRDLHKFIQKYRPIPVPVACTFASQIATALQHAYSRDMVHRDIKPSNVMVYEEDGRRQIKILDFGLAKATSEQQSAGLTADGTMLGTPEYMAPEQALDAASADIRADIYSLGCTLFHLLAGTPPFTGTYQSVLMSHAQTDAPFLNLQRPDVPVELAQAVAKMMAKAPSKRFQSPAAVATALKPFIGNAQVKPAEQATQAAVETRNHLASPSRDTSVEVAAAPQLAPAVKPDSAKSFAGVQIEDRTKSKRIAPTPLKKTTQSGRIRKPPLIAIIAGGLLAALVAFGIVLSLRTVNGTLVIENLPEDAQVLVDQEAVELQWNDGNDTATVRIKPGTRQLEVRSGGVVVAGETITIDSDSPVVFRVEPQMTLPVRKLTSDQSRELWLHSTGYFELIEDKTWEEVSPNGNYYYFREVSRNQEYIELDPINGKTDLTFRLYATHCDVSTQKSLLFKERFKGIWHPLGTLNQNTLDAAAVSSSPSPLFAGARFVGGRKWTKLGAPFSRGTKQACVLKIDRVEGNRFWGSITYRNGRQAVPVTGISQNEHIQFGKVDSFQERYSGTLRDSQIHSVSESGLLDVKLENGQDPDSQPDAVASSDMPATGQIWSDGNSTELLILDQNGDDFRARLIAGQRIMREVHGKMVGNQISWLAKDVRVLGGQKPGGDNFGTITKDSTGAKIDFEFNGTGGSGTFLLRPAGSITPPDDAAEFQGRYFKVVSDHLSWNDARDACTKMGGSLAMIDSPELNDFVYDLAAAKGVDSVWLGATDSLREGDWNWLSGVNLSYANWGNSQPNNKGVGEGFLTMLVSQENASLRKSWSDQPNKSVQHQPGYVCQWQPTPQTRSGSGVPDPPEVTAGNDWKPLFNENDLAGWTGDKSLWSNRDGVVVGVRGRRPAKMPSYLICDQPYDDFELKCKIKLAGNKADSGVMFRSAVIDQEKFLVGGPQCNVVVDNWCDFVIQGAPSYGYPTTGLQDSDLKVVEQVLNRAEFNDLHVRCVGDHVTFRLNGTALIDGQFEDIARGRLLAFQLWKGSNFEVYISDAMIRAVNPLESEK